MSGPARRARMASFAVAVLLMIAAPVAKPAAAERVYATVGRIVTRIVEGRTIVLIPVAGPAQLRLSEPFRLKDRSRLYLTIVDAKLSIPARPRRGEGVLGLTVTENSGDVTIAIDFARIGDYGMKPEEGGILLWVDPEPPSTADRARIREALAAGVAREAARVAPPEPENGSSFGLFALAGIAAIAGIAVRRFRSAAVHEIAKRLEQLIDRGMASLRGKKNPRIAGRTGR